MRFKLPHFIGFFIFLSGTLVFGLVVSIMLFDFPFPSNHLEDLEESTTPLEGASPFSELMSSKESTSTALSKPTDPYNACSQKITSEKDAHDPSEIFEIIEESTIYTPDGATLLSLTRLKEGVSYEIPLNVSNAIYYEISTGKGFATLQDTVVSSNGPKLTISSSGYVFDITLTADTAFWISGGYKSNSKMTQPVRSNYDEVISNLNVGDFITVGGYVDSKEDRNFDAKLIFLMKD